MGSFAKWAGGAGVAAVATLLLGTSSALAQNCGATTQTGATINNIGTLAVPTSSASASISAAIGNVNTAFLTQQGSAFVSAPANPAPDQPGGGVWARAVGGQVNISSTSQSAGVSTQAGTVFNTATTNCSNAQKENFAGVQVGADIARLNWSGWNVHLGTTAGYLGAKTTDNANFSNNFEVPFFGTYIVATKGRFFADLMVRQEFYNVSLNNPGFAFAGQPIGAHGFSVSASTGYNFDLGDSWFIEPSAGFIYSKTSVDNFTAPGVAGPSFTGITGIIRTNDVESEMGRLSLRGGKTIATPNVIWQPFASVSVFHEFAGNVTSNYTSLNGVFPVGGAPFTYNQTTTTSRVGTYGQYSLGVAGQIVNTGWLGFVRVDYRNGSNIDGWTGNAGIRYQFSPETIAAAIMPTKAIRMVKARPGVITATNWTGFYVGGFFGGSAGRTDLRFGDPATTTTRPWTSGVFGGGQFGYNYQFSNSFVLGVEGDIGAANIHGARTAGTSLTIPGLTSALFVAEDKTSWVATATARAGYAWERTLLYFKGGAAFENGRTNATCYNPQGGALAPPTVCANAAGVVFASGTGFGIRNNRVGWTLGYGTEFDLGKNWSAKAEYDYLSFGRDRALSSDGTTILSTKADSINQVKIGLNYRFAPQAVVAKY
ncbi:autotransporter domain-containing protein [Bradyrhizobium manausense]|uniref:autotransporter domain-containing protein n=1 Tax=Bradyrhizobium manausense TaxID=989370 RepID=UPI001BA89122|nr:autotransporter domain-containing protein [Bradyrhizobium manausense]MBR1092680.1 autotransporter domain-containing protein [Bradyrhizobium manausense]